MNRPSHNDSGLIGAINSFQDIIVLTSSLVQKLQDDKRFRVPRRDACITNRVAQNKVFWEKLTSPHELLFLLGQY